MPLVALCQESHLDKTADTPFPFRGGAGHLLNLAVLRPAQHPHQITDQFFLTRRQGFPPFQPPDFLFMSVLIQFHVPIIGGGVGQIGGKGKNSFGKLFTIILYHAVRCR